MPHFLLLFFLTVYAKLVIRFHLEHACCEMPHRVINIFISTRWRRLTHFQWTTVILATIILAFLLGLITETAATIAQPKAPNFQYFERWGIENRQQSIRLDTSRVNGSLGIEEVLLTECRLFSQSGKTLAAILNLRRVFRRNNYRSSVHSESQNCELRPSFHLPSTFTKKVPAGSPKLSYS